ncbi:MAG TPA: FecR domain-containing protein [Bryobacteraceae bacterium]|jgi:hypothetical protein
MALSGFRFAAFSVAGILCCLPLAAQNIISAKSGLIHYTEGDVKIGDQSASPNNGTFQSLAVGQELSTTEGRAEMLLAPGQFLRLNENSAVKMVSNKLDATRLEIERGSALVEVIDMARNAPITIALGSNVVELRKDGLYRIDADPSRLRVYDGEAVASGNGQNLTVKKDQEVTLGAVYAESHFDASSGDEFSRWAQRRAGYVATANVSAARDSALSGDDPRHNNWSYNSWYGMYTYLPNNRMYMSPFGFYYFSPDMAYNDMFWPYLGGGYGFYGSGFGYGYGSGLYTSCFYGCGYGLGYGYGYPSYGGGGGGAIGSPLNPRRGVPPSRPVGNPGGPVNSRGMLPTPSIYRGGATAGPVRGTGEYGNRGFSNGPGFSNGGGGGFSRASGGSASVSAAPVQTGPPAAARSAGRVGK